VRGELSLMRTYDHGRFTGPMRRVKAADGSSSLEPVTWEEAMNALVEAVRANPGKTFFLGGADTGTRDALIDQALAGLGSPGNRLRFEPYAQEALRSANELVFGTRAVPRFELGEADVVVAFGTDFIETWLAPLRNQSEYARARAEGKGFAAFVGPRLGLSGANTDQWIAPVPGTEVLVAIALASEVAKRKGGAPDALRGALAKYSAASVAERTGAWPRRRSRRSPIASPPRRRLSRFRPASRFRAPTPRASRQPCRFSTSCRAPSERRWCSAPTTTWANSRASRICPSSRARCAAARSACCSCTTRIPR
jgi:anaerobic selenocysteine-containing dehydrogenase